MELINRIKGKTKELFYEKDDKRIFPLDTFRFFFFICIFVHHCYNSVKVPLLRQASMAVSAFILLSGFLTGFIYIKKEIKIKDSINFTKKRIKKLYFLHLIMILITINLSKVFNYTKISDFIEFFKKLFSCTFLIQSWVNNKEYYFGFNGVTWFLSTYLFLSLITIPILLFFKKINKMKRKNICFFVLFVAMFSITIFISRLIPLKKLSNDFCEFWFYIFPPSRIMEYVIGIICGIICSNKKVSFKHDKAIFSVLEISIIVVLLLLMNNRAKILNSFSDFNFRYNMWIIPISLLIAIFSYQKGIISKLLSMKCLVYLGEISMYMFIIHQPLINIFSKGMGKIVHYRYYALYLLVLTIIISSIIDKYAKLKKLDKS